MISDILQPPVSRREGMGRSYDRLQGIKADVFLPTPLDGSSHEHPLNAEWPRRAENV